MPTKNPTAAAPDNGVAEQTTQVFGSITPEINAQVNEMRHRTNAIVGEIGRIEVRKDHLVRQVHQMEGQVRAMLHGEGQRLGIPDGTPWQLSPDGTAFRDLNGN